MNSKATLVSLALLTVLAPAGIGLAQEGRWIEPRCTVLPFTKEGCFVELSDGSLIAIEDEAAEDKGLYTSKDDGKTWSKARKVYDGPEPGIPSAAGVLIKTRDGVIVWVYMDMSTMKYDWDKAKNEPRDSMRLDVWTIRSLDDGKTWGDRQKVFQGWCGALMDIVQTRSGRIVVPVQRLLKDPGRNAVCTYVSDDNGKTWKHGNIIDLGGAGDHDGAMEPTLAELSDGRLLMLIRTNLDRFWEAFSEDDGLSWRVIRPSQIDASSAPGYLTRLASGRLALVWNRLHPEGKDDVSRRGGGTLSEHRASWHRDELSLAFSEDDGKTWSKPVVIARQPGAGGLAYPSIFERRPGELWITTRYNVRPPVCVSLKEKDFVGK
jgi:hypothetical protein